MVASIFDTLYANGPSIVLLSLSLYEESLKERVMQQWRCDSAAGLSAICYACCFTVFTRELASLTNASMQDLWHLHPNTKC